MNYQQFLFAVLFVVSMAFAAPNPHIGMVNNDDVRDVGAVYSQPEYFPKPTFLLMDKKNPRCLPLNGDDIMSIMICVESIECDFRKNEGCGSVSDKDAVFTVGCGDVPKLPLDLIGVYGSYKCHPVLPATEEPNSTIRLDTTPHDPNNDVLGQISLPLATKPASI